MSEYDVQAVKDKDSKWIELFICNDDSWTTVEMSTEIAKELAEELDIACTRLKSQPQKQTVYSAEKKWG